MSINYVKCLFSRGHSLRQCDRDMAGWTSHADISGETEGLRSKYNIVTNGNLSIISLSCAQTQSEGKPCLCCERMTHPVCGEHRGAALNTVYQYHPTWHTHTQLIGIAAHSWVAGSAWGRVIEEEIWIDVERERELWLRIDNCSLDTQAQLKISRTHKPHQKTLTLFYTKILLRICVPLTLTKAAYTWSKKQWCYEILLQVKITIFYFNTF